jgi:hypothetical protein
MAGSVHETSIHDNTRANVVATPEILDIIFPWLCGSAGKIMP